MNRKKNWFFFGCLIIFTCFVLSCTPGEKSAPSEGAPIEGGDTTASPVIDKSGLCESDNDCEEGFICIDGGCKEAKAPESMEGDPCAPDKYCDNKLDHVCVECSENFKCSNADAENICYKVPEPEGEIISKVGGIIVKFPADGYKTSEESVEIVALEEIEEDVGAMGFMVLKGLSGCNVAEAKEPCIWHYADTTGSSGWTFNWKIPYDKPDFYHITVAAFSPDNQSTPISILDKIFIVKVYDDNSVIFKLGGINGPDTTLLGIGKKGEEFGPCKENGTCNEGYECISCEMIGDCPENLAGACFKIPEPGPGGGEPIPEGSEGGPCKKVEDNEQTEQDERCDAGLKCFNCEDTPIDCTYLEKICLPKDTNFGDYFESSPGEICAQYGLSPEECAAVEACAQTLCSKPENGPYPECAAPCLPSK